MHPVGVDVVGKARGTADTGDEHKLLTGTPEAGKELLDRRQDRVVTTSGTPSDFLVGLEVASRVGRGCHQIISMIFSVISETLNGSPATLLSPVTSIRNSARITFSN